MGELKAVLKEETLGKFRKKAMEKFGYGKGSLSMAAEEAVEEWLESGKTAGDKPFGEAVRKAAGIWTDKRTGSGFVTAIRRESEKRLKRLGL